MFNLFKKRLKKEQIDKAGLLLFIGSPRTGSTFLGQLLNYHPQCLIANEYRLLNRVLIDGKDFKKEKYFLAQKALDHFQTGLSRDKKYSKSLSRSQSKWKPLNQFVNDPDFKKEDIRLVGDKKQGGNMFVYREAPEIVESFIMGQKDVFLIQIIRDPVESAISLMRSHKVESYCRAIQSIAEVAGLAAKLKDRVLAPYIRVYYEELLTNPRDVLRSVIEGMNLQFSEFWMEKIATVINAEGLKRHGTAENYQEAKEVISQYGIAEDFERYFI